jgi:hypothetical protein
VVQVPVRESDRLFSCDSMEPPGSPELDEAYQRYVSEPDVNR